MHDALAALALAAATATPTPTPTLPDPESVTPGPEGFIVIAVIAILTILLIGDMIRRIRRGRVRADIDEELEAEREAAEQGARATEATTTDDESADADDAGDRPRG